MGIYVGNYEIIDSGSVMNMRGESIVFNFHDLQYEFAFNDTFGEKTEVKTGENTGKQLKLILCNFNNSLPTSNNEEYRMGTINGKQLLFNFSIVDLGNGKKIMNYTWYLEKGGANV